MSTAYPLSSPIELVDASPVLIQLNNTDAATQWRLETNGGNSFLIGTTANPGVFTIDPASLTVATTSRLTRGNGFAFVYDSAGGQTFANAIFTDVTWDTVGRLDSDFTFTAGTSTITINTAGDYRIEFDLGMTKTVNDTRAVGESRIMRDPGGGFAELPGTRGNSYHRTTTGGEGTSHVKGIWTLTAGDLIKVQARRETGTGSLVVVPDGARLNIECV